MGKLSLFRELFAFIRIHKKLWLLPMLLIIALLSLLLIFAQSSPLAPIIYTVF